MEAFSYANKEKEIVLLLDIKHANINSYSKLFNDPREKNEMAIAKSVVCIIKVMWPIFTDIEEDF